MEYKYLYKLILNQSHTHTLNAWLALAFCAMVKHAAMTLSNVCHFNMCPNNINIHSFNTWLVLGLCAIGATGHLVVFKD